MSASQKKYSRSLKNFLLDPLFQFKFGAYMVATILLFLIIVAAFTYYSLNEFIRLLIVLSEIPDSVQQYLNEITITFIVGLIVILIVFSLITLLFIIVQTHRIVGAGYAIKRHIQENLMEGNFDTQLTLRKKDYFKDIADCLNNFSKKMKEKNNG